MLVIDFETAKRLAEKLNIYKWKVCLYLYAKDDKKLIDWSSMEADYYLKDNDRFYPAPFFQEVFEFIKNEYGWNIFILSKNINNKIITYSMIIKDGDDKDYSSGICNESDVESVNRAIQETIELILEEKEMYGN
jgi:hypothetical protein